MPVPLYYTALATRGQQFAFSNYKASKIQLSPKVKNLNRIFLRASKPHKKSTVLTALSWSPFARTPVGFPGRG